MTVLLKKAKENLFFIIVILCYITLFFAKPNLSINSVKNSAYYLKEMLVIMPVIFILTSLLDTWVPKNTIMKFLGKNSGWKGTLLSFLLGGISAGPIYAAFPVCVMLHKKGATINNIVIILSSWAVIKFPMLLNEVKFLGPKFMIIRWIFTVISILLFAYITSKIVKDNDLPQKHSSNNSSLYINKNACMGCTLCTKNYPELFVMQNKKAFVKEPLVDIDKQKLHNIIEGCPVKAIEFSE